MKLRLGFSPCPNDTFIFDAMIHHKIDTEGLEFDTFITDVEELNNEAQRNIIDITKLSFHAYAEVARNYIILDAGSALGNNNGPLLISKRKIYPDQIYKIKKAAIPGKFTTANLLLSIACPEIKDKTEYHFAEIEQAVLDEKADAGLIIHENRFTFEKKGLKKIIDLGEFWETRTRLPIPLGAIAINRKIDSKIQEKVNRVLRRSVEFANQNPTESKNFTKQYAQNIDDEVIEKHINLYVNEFTIDLGDIGKTAIDTLFAEAAELNIIKQLPKNIYIS